MVYGIVFTGGVGPERSRILKYLSIASLTVAADSGLLLAERIGVVPDYIVGDMDSLTDPVILKKYPKSSVKISPTDKDETDTELGITLLYEKGFEDVIIIGGGGGRLDHLLAIFSLFHRRKSPRIWITDKEELVLIDSTFSFTGSPGSIISFLPVGESPATMNSTGLKWPLDTLTWKNGDTGISNVMVAASASIQMRSGKIVMIRSWENL
jgi:thiamine pyrophosphokinase